MRQAIVLGGACLVQGVKLPLPAHLVGRAVEPIGLGAVIKVWRFREGDRKCCLISLANHTAPTFMAVTFRQEQDRRTRLQPIQWQRTGAVALSQSQYAT